MKHVVIISNIPSPYRAALFAYLQENSPGYRFSVLYTGTTEEDRAWSVDCAQLKSSYFLHARVLNVRGGEVGGTARRFIHLSGGMGDMLAKLKPDVIIASEYNPSAIQALMYAKRRRIPYINLTDGTLHSESYIGLVQKLTRKLIISQAQAFLASSTKAKEKLLYWGAEEKKIATSYLTVDVSPYVSLLRQPEPNRILYVGRISREKGLDLLIAALAHTQAPCTLHVVGNDVGQEQQKLLALSKELGVDNRICWLGYREGEALLQEYAGAGILAVPSRSDCFGLVMLEAACAGVPVVASRYADGSYDIITPGTNGQIADPEDAVAFAAALDAGMQQKQPDEALRHSLAEKFSFRKAAEGYAQALSIALGGRVG